MQQLDPAQTLLAMRGVRRSAIAIATGVCVCVVGLFAAPSSGQAQGSASEVERLTQRIEQLEGQLVDLQVVIGTLESLASNPRGASGSSSGGGSTINTNRLNSLETQVQALAAQINRDRDRASAPQLRGTPEPQGAETRGSLSPGTLSGFGSTTVRSSRDPIGGLLSGTNGSVASAGTEIDPNDQYEAAYGALLQQNYVVAQSGFENFLASHPRHRLAGNAQYWLGEVYYVRGDYKSAANAFLKGYETYSDSSKAPDSLLKLAMSLDRLGARDDACASFSAINQRFPNAENHVRNRAESELRRLRCS